MGNFGEFQQGIPANSTTRNSGEFHYEGFPRIPQLTFSLYCPGIALPMNHRFRLLFAWFAVLGFLSAVVILRDGVAEQTAASTADEQEKAEKPTDSTADDAAETPAKTDEATDSQTDAPSDAPADAPTDAQAAPMLPPLIEAASSRPCWRAGRRIRSRRGA